MVRIVRSDLSCRLTAMILAVILVLSAIPFYALATTDATVSTDIAEKAFTVGTAGEFGITTVAGDDADKEVIAGIKFSDTSALDKLEHYDAVGEDWVEVTDAGENFSLSDETRKYRVTFKKAGIFSVEISIRLADDEGEICSTVADVYVNGSSAIVASENGKTVAQDQQSFLSFSVFANDDKDKNAVGFVEFDDPESIEKLEYFNDDHEWVSCGDDNRFADGVVMTDMMVRLRGVFKKVGKCSFVVGFKDKSTDDTLCFVCAEVVVKKTSDISFTSENIEIKFSDINATNDTLVDAVEGASYEYTSSDEKTAKVNEHGIITPVGVGSAKITVTRVENDEYVAASAEYTVTIVPGVQGELKWDKSVPDSIAWNVPDGYSNTVSGGSGNGEVEYSSSDADIAEVDPSTGKLTLKKPGTVTITATKSGVGLYDDESVTYTLVITKAKQESLVFDESNPDAISVGDKYQNPAKGGSVGEEIAIKYSVSDDTIASIDENGTLTALRVPLGMESVTVTVTASLNGNDYYLDIAPISYSITIRRATYDTPAYFEKGNVDQKIKYGDEYTNAVLGINADLAVYTSSDESIASVESGTGKVTSHKAGVVTISVTIPETEQYGEQSLSYELVIERASQEVTFENGNVDIPAIIYGDVYRNTASAVTGITYTSSDKTIAEVDENGSLIIHRSGNVTITAQAEETDQYESASSSYSITINKVQQIVFFDRGNIIDTVYGEVEGEFLNSASSNAFEGDDEDKQGIDITYSITSGGDCIVDGSFAPETGKFEITRAGTIVISVLFSANDRYEQAEASYTLVIEKADQSIAFESDSFEIINGDNSFVCPELTNKGVGTGKITYSIEQNEDGVVGSIDPETGKLEFTFNIGTVVVLATKAEDDCYNSAVARYTLIVADDKNDQDKNYHVDGLKNDDSDWYMGNVSIIANEGYAVSTDKTDWQDSLADIVSEDGVHTVEFYVRDKSSGHISDLQKVIIKKDTVSPTAVIKVGELSVWDKILSIITLGMWEPSEMEFTIESDDTESKVKDGGVKYLVAEGTDAVMTEEELNAVTEWTDYDKVISVSSDKLFVLYAKVTDNAGNVLYATTNAVIFDRTPVNADDIVVDVITKDNSGFYNSDVELGISVTDALPSSGIAKISYKVLSGDTETQSGELFSFDIEAPTYAQLISSWSSSENDHNLIVDSQKNNADGIKVVIIVLDNAGNESEKEIVLNICKTEPTFEVVFEDDPAPVDSHDGVDYYDAPRIAKIIITGRTSVFDASDAPVVTIKETGEKTYETVDWKTEENSDDPDAATHTYQIKFNGSAEYEFSFEYKDIFGNSLNYLSDKFSIVRDKPSATITIDDSTTWTTILETLTFGRWRNYKLTVKATPIEATSPIKEFEMYVSYSDKLLTNTQLDELYEQGKFDEYKEFEIADDAKFAVYIRVEDYAGHVEYVCSDGFVLDTTESEIVLTPDTTDRYHNDIPLYNGDVDVLIKVVENAENSYSGIKEVKYQVICDGNVTKEENIYTFGYSESGYPDGAPTYEELLHEFEKTITIDSQTNNSCDVKLVVTVTDNAGNVSTQSIVVDIDISAPIINIVYDNNLCKSAVGDRGYYSAARNATVTIIEREGHFDADKAMAGIKIKATDIGGRPIAVNGKELSVDDEGYLADISDLFVGCDLEWKTDGDKHMLVLPFVYDANYTFAAAYEDLAGNVEICNVEGQKTPFEFTVDTVAPTATVSIQTRSWDKIVEILTFGLFTKEDVKVVVKFEDLTSDVDLVECCKSNKTDILSIEELENCEWDDVTADPEVTVSDEGRLVVYFRITDRSGNQTYVSSDGYVVDKTEAKIELIPDTTDRHHNNIPLYNGDVKVLINVSEQKDDAYSGIKEVKYQVICDGNITKEETLYTFDYSESDHPDRAPTYEELLHEFKSTVTIDSKTNNSCNVKLVVTVTDNAGNISTQSIAVDIDITAPIVSVVFDNNAAYKTIGKKGYFPNARRATVTVVDRAGHIDAKAMNEAIGIVATNAVGKKTIDDYTSIISDYSTSGAGNETKHIVNVDFSADANYEFDICCTDLAGHKSNEESFEFAVDKTAPEGSVTVKGLGTWDKIVETLTFGLWSKNSVDVTANASDDTTSIESLTYFKTNDSRLKTRGDLDKITSWAKFNSLSISANEKFVIYLKIVDDAGNVSYISTNGIIVDDRAPTIESVKPEITITPEPSDGIYNSDVTVSVSVVDQAVGEADAYAGIKEIRYEIFNMGRLTQSGSLYSFGVIDPTFGELRQSWDKADAIVVDKDLNNSNDVKIVVYATDNAGNENLAECDIKIDITAPEVEISYDNNEYTIGADGKVYFSADRTATIVVTERNFDPAGFMFPLVNADGGSVPTVGEWTTVKGGENGDDTKHTAHVVFNEDGDYSFVPHFFADAAGNICARYNYLSDAATEFVVDKTAPVVDIKYDNNNAANGNYYNAKRVATITITEHNFAPDGVDITADGATIGEWKSNGDTHTLTITYDEDGLYEFELEYVDRAGNKIINDIEKQTFYIDTTAPTVSISGIVDKSANNADGDIGFVITVSDDYHDIFEPTLTMIGSDDKEKVVNLGNASEVGNDRIYTVTNIESDGIYRITCKAADKAGNAFSKVTLQNSDGTFKDVDLTEKDVLLTFSVNRNGSTFKLDSNTTKVVEDRYVKQITDNVVITEINVDELTETKVKLNNKDLDPSVDYTIEAVLGDGQWKQYTYTIKKSLFESEGEYNIVIESTDMSDNKASSDVKGLDVKFVVDYTAPVVTVSGITDGGRYQTNKQLVTLIPVDGGGELNTLVVALVDGNGKVIEDLISLAGESLIGALEANDGMITFEIPEGLYQNVRIVCTDRSTGDDGQSNVYDVTIKNISISSSTLMILWANKTVRFTVIGGACTVVAITVVALILVKKKKRGTTAG